MNIKLKIVCWAGFLGLLLSAGSALADDEWKLRVDLVDGSRIIGSTANKSLKLDVGFDELTIPLERVRRVQPGDKAKTVRVELDNRDVYTGKLNAEPLILTTIFGPVKLSMDQIVSLEVFPANMAAWLPTQTGLVFYYPLDDGDSATNHAADKHHGKSNNVKWVEKGLRDGSLEYDGTGRTYIAHHEDLCPQAFTLAAWIHPIGQSSSYQMVIAKTNAGSWQPGYGIVRNSGDATHLTFFVNSYYTTTVRAPVPFDKWSHVAGTFDGVNLKFYLNGKLAESKNLKTAGLIPADAKEPVTHTTTPLVFGGDQGQSYGWQGMMDEVVFYSRALDADDVYRLYDVVPRQLGPVNDGLVKPPATDAPDATIGQEVPKEG